MLRKVFIVTTLLLSSCAFKLWEEGPQSHQREIASLSLQQLVEEEEQGFALEVDEKLNSLHSYHLIAQKFLQKFDQDLEDKGLLELYQSEAYLSLIATRTQMDEIQDELKELDQLLKKSKKKNDLHKRAILGERLLAFSRLSGLHAASLEGLGVETTPFTAEEFETEYQRRAAQKEFQIFEKNIEHISHLMEMRLKKDNENFRPSSGMEGNISGLEFPSKVWSLTFDDGPHSTYSREVVQNLKEHNLKATFFMLGREVKKTPETARMILGEGMEMASHSFSHRPLTLVGNLTLDQEIGGATQEMEKALKVQIKFFRLPYGIGIRTPHIRDKIVAQKLIHVIYNVDSLDWIAQNPDKIIKRTKALMKKTPQDAGILLFHDTHKRSVIASKAIMEYLKLDGRRTCTLGQIVDQMNEGAETVCPNF